LPDVIEDDEVGRTCEFMEEKRDVYSFINNNDGKRPWENFKMDFKETQWDGVQQIQLAQDKD
jgi:hypothetical protein